MVDIFSKANFYAQLGIKYEVIKKNDILDDTVIKAKDVFNSTKVVVK